MKNKDAIEILETMAMAESTFSDEESKKCCEAIDLAVEALKREIAGIGEQLTLEQLKEMDEKPVRMEDLTGDTLWNQWIIFEQHTDEGFIPRGGGYFGFDSYNVKWRAYAYPPAHIDLEAWEPCENCNPKCAICANCGGWDRYGKPKICEDCKSFSNFIADDEFCSYCGRPLTPKARAELEKRLRG